MIVSRVQRNPSRGPGFIAEPPRSQPARRLSPTPRRQRRPRIAALPRSPTRSATDRDARRGQTLIVWAIEEGRRCAGAVDAWVWARVAEPVVSAGARR